MTLLDRSSRLVLGLGLSLGAAVLTHEVGGWALRGVISLGLQVVPA